MPSVLPPASKNRTQKVILIEEENVLIPKAYHPQDGKAYRPPETVNIDQPSTGRSATPLQAVPLKPENAADALRAADAELHDKPADRTMQIDVSQFLDDDADLPDRTMMIEQIQEVDASDPAEALRQADQELHAVSPDRTMKIDPDMFLEDESDPMPEPEEPPPSFNPAQAAETILAPADSAPFQFQNFRISDLADRTFWDALDNVIAGWMARHGTPLLRWTLGIIFIWFGALKPLGLSPAQELVSNTVYWVNPAWFVPLLGYWEVLIGIGLLIKPLIRPAIALLFLQMPGTFFPLILLPDVCFTRFPIGLTLEGQYIIKNLVIIGAALVIGSTVRDDE